MDCSLPSAPIGKSKTSRTCAMTAVVSSSYFASDFFAFLPPPMPNNASACRCVLFEEKNRLVYCGVFLVSSFKVCFSRRPLLYSIRFSSSFLRLVEKHRRNRPTKERKIEDVIARDAIRRVRFFVVKAQNKGASSSSFTKSARAPVSASSSSSRPTRRALLSSKRRGDRHHRQFYGRPFPVVFASILTMRTQKIVVVSKRMAGGVFSSTRRDSSCWSASR